MKHPDYILTKENNQYKYHSNLAGLALELANKLQESNFELAKQLSELSKSYRTLTVSALKSYLHLHYFYTKHSKTDDGIYQIMFIISNFTYSFITQSKSSLDLLTCILDCIENRVFKDEYELTDFNKYLKKGDSNKKLNTLLKLINDEEWISELTILRNRLIHRGFEITFEYRDINSLRRQNKYNVEIIDPEIEYFISKNSTFDEEDKKLIELGFVKDSHGRIKSKINLDKLVKKFNGIQEREKEICDLLIQENLVDNILEYESFKTDYGLTGEFVRHPKIFSIKRIRI